MDAMTQPQKTPPKPNAAPGDELLTIAEVAGYLKLSRRTAWRWCKSGKLPAAKVGHQWRIARSDLEQFLRRRNGAGRA
ncbi:MAG: helix-turn-helix domain-containing protein [Anaerolineae bacterium]